jgi:signal transduction histidine kinase
MSKREAKLNQAQDQLLLVLDNLPIPVACQRLVQPGTSTLNGKLILLNRQFVETFGYPAAELVTVADWAERAYPDPSYRQDLFARFDAALAASCRSTPLGANGQVDSFDVRIVCADGHVREAQVFAAICDDLLITTLVDLSEQLLVERQLAMTLQRQSQQEQQQRQQLERKLRSSLSAAAVVHEIKQPLSTMLLQCRLGLTLLQQQGFDAGFEVERTLQNLNDQADQVVEIMERMRMLLRNVETDHQAVDLSLTVESTLLFLRRELEQAGIEVSSEGLDQSCHVLGDAVQLQIAIVNVLRNSIEAMAERGGRRRLQVWLGRHADEAVVRVSDSGPGFAAEANALVLNSSKTQGSGIGLFVVRTTLDHHQGRLVIARSPELGGAAVELRLPRLPAEATAAADPGDGQ